MNFRYTNLFLAALLCGVGAIARAQLPFFENFDAMRADSYDWNSQGRLLAGEFDYGDDEAPPKVRGPRDGVTPYSGNRMFEMRASVYKDRIRTMRPHIDSIFTNIGPSIELSLRFFVPSSYTSSNTIIFGIDGLEIATGRYEFNLESNVFHYRDYTEYNAHQTFAFPIARDAWNSFQIRLSGADRKVRTFVNGTALTTRAFTSFFGGPYTIGPMYFGVVPLQNTSGQHTAFEGAPGYFVDDVKVAVVPEPLTLMGVLAGLLLLVSIRLARETVS